MCLNMPANAIELMKVLRNAFLAESWTVIEIGERKLASLAGLNTGGCTPDVPHVATRWRGFQRLTDCFSLFCRAHEGSALARSASGGR